MFEVIKIKDIIRIEPRNFQDYIADAIEQNINKKLSNKVILKIGLGICLWDILKIGDCEIHPGDGAYHATVEYRFVVFKPLLNETIVGTIVKCSSEGIQITLDFFDDIIIPPANIPQPSHFDTEKNCWVWVYQMGESEHNICIDVTDRVTFKVVDYVWKDSFPTVSSTATDNRTQQERSNAPLTIIGTIIGYGLGLPCWWDSDKSEADESE